MLKSIHDLISTIRLDNGVTMPGNKNSGRRSRVLSQEEARHALRKLTRKSVTVIKDSLDRGEVATAWRILEHVIGKPRLAQDSCGHDKHTVDIEQVQGRAVEISQEVMEGAIVALVEAGVSIDISGYHLRLKDWEINQAH